MPDKPSASSFPAIHEPKPPAADSTGAAAKSPSNRGPELRDSVAEIAERAQLIGQEAGSKIASAMRDVIGTAAGVAGFAVESVRDLVQYMVRRGQMTQDEADRLIREAEEARGKRGSRAERGTAKADSKLETKSESKPAASANATSRETPAARGTAKTAKKAATKPSAAASEKKPAAKKPAPKKRR